ncbi:MAG: cytochrome P450, partial [Caulobacteraceae bacterium]
QRVAARAMEVAGCPVHAGQVVAVSIERANRDPAVFPEPDRFDIGRHDGPHLSFGAGAHICIGAALARLEAKVAILALIQRFPRLALADPNAPPAWRPAPYFRGLARLEVVAGKEPRPLDPIEGKGSLPL